MKKRIPLTQVIPNPAQPRKLFEVKALRELADSIRERGLMQAITVRPAGGHFVIVGGERRWRAHCLLAEDGVLGKEPTILCEVEEMSDHEMALKAIIENLQRADLRAVEEARAFKAMLDMGWTVEKLAKDLGVQPRRIADRTALLNLDETIQSLVDAGQFPLGHATYLTDLSKADQMAIVQLYAKGKLPSWSSVQAAAQAARDRRDQNGMFDRENRPEPSKGDMEAINRMERTVERIVAAISSGWRDGECVAIKTVDPNRAEKCAETLAAASRSIRNMEAELRRVHARAQLI
ncbi:ParB/RepB/Spo0J family partition protein [Mesorhizobium sp. M0058]|uniref:ParB/RepB/Spo0J family partition protein n=1 Tax=Mesorhizobium sp. M0058 TaxID=2956865 RepID=UPI00333AE790